MDQTSKKSVCTYNFYFTFGICFETYKCSKYIGTYCTVQCTYILHTHSAHLHWLRIASVKYKGKQKITGDHYTAVSNCRLCAFKKFCSTKLEDISINKNVFFYIVMAVTKPHCNVRPSGPFSAMRLNM